MPKHPFNDGSLSTRAMFRPQRKREDVQAAPVQGIGPFDPVLRQALISKGVITPDDLMEAERTIRAVTASMIGGEDGQQPGR